MFVKRMLYMLTVFALVCATLLSLTSCGDGYYSPIKSSKQDRRVVMELGEAEVNYELFRFLFMSCIDDYDNGDRTLWNSADGEALWKQAEAAVLDEIAEIYAVFEVLRKWGMDPNSESIQTSVEESIKLDIDGGYLSDGTKVSGFGSVKAYEATLEEMYCTDAVRRLLYQYKACLEALDSYIIEYRGGGKITVTDDELLAFAESDRCAHVNRVFVSFESFLYNYEAARERVENLRRKLLDAGSDYDTMVEEVFSKNLTYTESDPSYGVWYGRLSTSERDYPDYHNAIFTATPGSISEIIEEWDGYYIVYGMDRTVDLSNLYTKQSLNTLYLEEMYWGEIRDTAAALKSGAVYTKHYAAVTPSALMSKEH